jgi:hypothetical protein
MRPPLLRYSTEARSTPALAWLFFGGNRGNFKPPLIAKTFRALAFHHNAANQLLAMRTCSIMRRGRCAGRVRTK